MTQQVNDKDIFELTRGELNGVIAYLGKRPAEETFHLLNLLLSRGPARLVQVEQAAPEVPEETKSTEQ